MNYLKNKNYRNAALLAIVMLLLSAVINYYAGTYATERASSSVTDIVLSNVPVVNLDGIFVYGAVLFWIFTGLLCITEPQHLPFIFKSLALFIVIRSLFISLTHIGPFLISTPIGSSIISKFSFGGDLFFSGHTGLPFLLALIFWEDKLLRNILLSTSVAFGAVVLLAHLHYSIDVLSAFFITYTIFHLSEIFFKKDRQLFFEGPK